MKLCRECNSEIPKSIIVDNKRRNLKNRTRCLNCLPFGSSPYSGNSEERKTRQLRRKAKNQRDYYNRSKKNNIDHISRLRIARKKGIINLVGGCQICGYNRCQRNLAFHHIDESTKSHSITSREFQFAFSRVKPELEKCILVCHNCHGEIHDSLISENVISQCHVDWLEKLAPVTSWPLDTTS